MKRTNWKKFGIIILLLTFMALTLSGCSGDDGATGPAGATGATGATGPAGKDFAVNVATMSSESLADLSFSTTESKVTGVVIDSPPKVSFKVIDASGNGITGLGVKNTVGTTLNYLRFSIAKLVPGTNGSPDAWVSYMVTDTSLPLRESNGDLVDNGDGSYVYTFIKDVKSVSGVTYDGTLTHRVAIQISGNIPGTSPAVALKNPLNIIYDWVPAGGAVTAKREIVRTANCFECHGKFAFHGGGRQDTRMCVVCHTDQWRMGKTEAAVDASGNFTAEATAAGTYLVNDRAVPNFANMIHKIHMGNKLTKQGYNFEGVLFNEVAYPQDIRNCRKCHSESTATPQGDNWKTKPSRLACGACHDGVDFATGTGHGLGGIRTDESACAVCHTVDEIERYHTLPSTADATQRTMSATITGVVVDSNGGVTVTFTMTDNGVPVTDRAKFSNPEFSLAKLVPGAGGASSDWVSYTSRYRTKDAAVAPVLQGYNESNGTVTDLGGGTWSYKFKLITAEPEGDIRNVTHAHNVSTVAGVYNSANWPTGPNIVTYEPTLTHRVAMIFQKVGTPNIDNATNAYFDFVPNGAAVTETRNIVTTNNCAVCHAGIKRHKGYAIELCVTCHNQGTSNPYSGGESVDLQRFIHKLHMGKNLPSVIAGGTFIINGENYGELAYPGIIKNCRVCHVEGAGAPNNAANWRTIPTSRACGTCHDSAIALAHISSNVVGGTELCAVCHGAGKTADVVVVHK